MTIDRYGIHIGVLFIHFYGLILMSGVVAAAFMSSWRAGKYRQNPEHVWDMLTYLVIAGVIGARLWHIFTPPPSLVEQGITVQYYLTHPLDALAIWNGGLGIFGAVAGGAIALFFYTRHFKLNMFTWLDIVAPGLALAQAIGRWGNFVNQELYGLPTNLPWAIFIDPAHRVAPFYDQAYYHPLFLYESIWNLVNMGLLLWVGKRFANRLRTGDLFCMYAGFYALGRFLLDFIRVDASQIGALNANQSVMGLIFLVSFFYLLWHIKSNHAPKAGKSDDEQENVHLNQGEPAASE